MADTGFGASPQRQGNNELRTADGDAITSSPFATLTGYNISIFYILWYFFVTHWAVANYAAWVRFEDALLGDSPNPKLYLAAIIIGTALFWVVTGPMFFYSGKYKKGPRDGYKWLSIGIVISFLGQDTPMWLLDVSIYYWYGFQSVVQTITLLLRTLSFLLNATISWHIYMHRISKTLQQVFGKKTNDLRVIADREAVLRQREMEGKKPMGGGGGYN